MDKYDPLAPFYVITCKKCGFIGWSTRQCDKCIRSGVGKGECDGEAICETPHEHHLRISMKGEFNETA